MSRFLSQLGSGGSVFPLLPLTHVTSAHGLRGVIDSKGVDIADCSVFGEKLSYWFYGRPAYKLGDIHFGSKALYHAPVCLIANPKNFPTPKRAFPFDSGAFDGRKFNGIMPKKASLADFELEPSFKAAQRVVGKFYESNEEYLLANPKQNITHNNWDFELSAYHTLIRAAQDGHEAQRFDERSSSIEFQFAGRIPFPSAFDAIVLPSPLLNGDDKYTGAIKKSGLHLIPYPVFGAFKQSEYTKEFFLILRDYCDRNHRGT